MAVVYNRAWTLKKLIQNTYSKYPNRFEYKIRDLVGVVRIKSIKTYDSRSGKYSKKYVIETKSYPQYKPFFTTTDSRGRERNSQRTIKHNYECHLQLEDLSITSPFRAREGSLMKPIFGVSPSMKYKTKKKKIKIKDGSWEWKEVKVPDKIENDINAQRGVNLDFVYRSMWVWAKEGILYGRNWTNRPPAKTNPRNDVFAGKHLLAVIEYLMSKGVLKK